MYYTVYNNKFIRKIKIVECTFPYVFPWQCMFNINVIMSLIITLHSYLNFPSQYGTMEHVI